MICTALFPRLLQHLGGGRGGEGRGGKGRGGAGGRGGGSETHGVIKWQGEVAEGVRRRGITKLAVARGRRRSRRRSRRSSRSRTSGRRGGSSDHLMNHPSSQMDLTAGILSAWFSGCNCL